MDYGHDLQFGVFITPTATPAQQAVEMAVAAENAGLDLATFQDHPYQHRFLDTWTLIAYAAARTKRIHLGGNVLNLPLRQPAVLAKSAASLDRLSGGRVEMGLGAGGFWDAIESMGGRRLSAGESIDALEEAMTIMRQLWDMSERGGVFVDGQYYHVNGARRGPAPAHDIPIWVGAYKPKILRLVGRAADGVVPSLPYLQGGPSDLNDINKYIDEGAEQVGRPVTAIRRMLNISGQFTRNGTSLLNGPPAQWAEDLASIALEYGVSTFIVMGDDAAAIELFANEVVPTTKALVAAERTR